MNILHTIKEHTLPTLLRRVLNQLEIRNTEAKDYMRVYDGEHMYEVGLYIKKLEEK